MNGGRAGETMSTVGDLAGVVAYNTGFAPSAVVDGFDFSVSEQGIA
jgi:hypothetical protein